jgi:energy-coupling factor transporter transmembrane protein EcfT
MGHKYSVKKIIGHDYITLVAFIAFVIVAAISLEIYFIGYMFSKRTFEIQFIPIAERLFYIYIFGSMTLIGMICFIVRINIIKNYFDVGIEVKGIIVELSYWRDRGKIIYEYSIEGQEYRRKLAMHITKVTSNLGKNDEIRVLVKPENHSKAIIKDIFTEKE